MWLKVLVRAHMHTYDQHMCSAKNLIYPAERRITLTSGPMHSSLSLALVLALLGSIALAGVRLSLRCSWILYRLYITPHITGKKSLQAESRKEHESAAKH